MAYQLNGIQQIGIGVEDLESSWKWYRKAFGMDVPIFQDKAEAILMKEYTGGEVYSRHAVLAMNMQGGGGFEIWQFTNRTPIPPINQVQWGDLGIFAVKIRSKNIEESVHWMESCGSKQLTPIIIHPDGNKSFFIRDPFDNVFEICECHSWFSSGKHLHGGVMGVCIGVSDLQTSKALYQDLLGFSELAYHKEELCYNWEGGLVKTKRALLTMKGKNPGAFGALLCPAQIELVQVMGTKPNKIFKNRFWGDLGFIHCCLDINGTSYLRDQAQENGFAFTVDSENSFDMGKAAGHFCYLEDPDGTLIELVETHKVPIFEKLNLFLDLRTRNPEKNLPKLLVKMLGLNRVRD
ncbi:VOC family protein [Algoriphagus mannitolivorans]|uniref:VOC family protein n=1 Tax=Algoriphagus mannitolivorans TaxID=226504 RepID=UPI00041A8275|nr:VOC family protein [Algoriphagus mannitolivorans]